MIERKNSRVSHALIYLFLTVWALIVLFGFPDKGRKGRRLD